jgi:hypothetical protein
LWFATSLLSDLVPRPTFTESGLQGRASGSESRDQAALHRFGGVAAMPACRLTRAAPCHTLPGRVGERRGVNQAYDLAELRKAGAHNVVGERTAE